MDSTFILKNLEIEGGEWGVGTSFCGQKSIF